MYPCACTVATPGRTSSSIRQRQRYTPTGTSAAASAAPMCLTPRLPPSRSRAPASTRILRARRPGTRTPDGEFDVRGPVTPAEQAELAVGGDIPVERAALRGICTFSIPTSTEGSPWRELLRAGAASASPGLRLCGKTLLSAFVRQDRRRNDDRTRPLRRQALSGSTGSRSGGAPRRSAPGRVSRESTWPAGGSVSTRRSRCSTGIAPKAWSAARSSVRCSMSASA